MSPTVILFAGGLLVFAGVTLSLSLVGVVTAERRGVARSLAAIQALDAAPDVLRAGPRAARSPSASSRRSASGSSASAGAWSAPAPPSGSSTDSTSPATRPPGT